MSPGSAPVAPQDSSPRRAALSFTEIAVQRMPGFRRQGFSLANLSPGVNLIHGPNGSGKTTTARALAGLLWPGTLQPSCILSSRLNLRGTPGVVTLEAGRSSWQLQGRPIDPPPLGVADADRYYLSLADLLQATEQGSTFAEHILQEAAGGYNIGAVARQLNFDTNPPGTAKLPDNLRQARAAVDRAQIKMEELHTEEARLAGLAVKEERARDARRRAALLMAAIAVVTAHRKNEELDRQLSELPSFLQQLQGDEDQRLQQLATRREEATAEINEERRKLAAAEAALAAARLPDGGVALRDRQAWDLARQELRDLEKSLREGEQQLAALAAARTAAAEGLGAARLGEEGAGITGAHLDELDELARLTAAVQHRQGELQAEDQALAVAGAEVPAGSADPVTATDSLDPELQLAAIHSLSQWLLAPGVEAGRRWVDWAAHVLALALAAVGVERIVGGSLGLVAGVAFGLAAGGGLLAMWRSERRQRDGDGSGPAGPSRTTCRAQFESLNQGREPATWTPPAVTTLLRALLQELRTADARRQIEERRRQLARELADLGQRESKLIESRTALAQQLGLPAAAGLWEVALLAKRLAAWRDARDRQRERRAAQEQTAAAWRELLDTLNARLTPLGFPPCGDANDAAGALAELGRRDEEWQQAHQQIGAARRAIDRIAAEVDRLVVDRRSLLARLQLPGAEAGFESVGDPDIDRIIHRGLEQLPRFKELQQQRYAAQQELIGVKAEFAELGGDPALVDHPLPALHEALEQAKGQADELEPVLKEAAGIRKAVELAKGGTMMADALAQRERAEIDLLNLFDDTLRRRLGRLLTDAVQAEAHDKGLPTVFHRARELFVIITNGHYMLGFNEAGDEPEFYAVDQTTGEGRTLAELSDGTRVQLLLAVRMAFVELYEQDLRLPLVLDEVLANSDDERAGAVIAAVLALARAGRQIFYFTAQHDEVVKWQAALNNAPDVPTATVDLAAIRAMSVSKDRPLAVAAAAAADSGTTAPTVPAPAQLTYGEYGKLLNVPGVDAAAPAHSLHLWHLLTDTADLYRLLQTGVSAWGPLRTLADIGGQAGWDQQLRDAYAKARAGAEVMAAALAARQIGRGQPVDRQVLAASGAVTNVFIERVSRLADKLAGDAKQLVAALAAGQMPRFQKTEDLRLYLTTHHYLDPRPVLPPTDVYLYALAAAQPHLASGHLNKSHVQRMADAVTGTPQASSPAVSS